MPRRAFWSLALVLSATSADAGGDDGDVRASVVKISAVQRPMDLGRPWLRPVSNEISGSGLVIDGKRILTNAHVAAYSTQISVQGTSSDKFSATVEAIATGIDLAVLKLDDESFFDGKPPIPISEAIPRDRDNVLVYGYPTGGTNLSVTKGIVSRVEFAAYDQETWGLRAQIDAAINPGNSGGPVVSEGKLVGVAFSRLGGADNIGYVIPGEEVRLFLDDVKDGKYDGKPTMFDVLQTLENPSLKKRLNVPAGVTGIVVHKPEPPVAGDTPLKEWDIITKIGDHDVDNTGMSTASDGLNLRFQYYVQKLVKDGKIPLTVRRDGQSIEVEVPVGPWRPLVIPTLHGGTPSYFIYGPIVFANATNELVIGAERAQRGWITWLAVNKSPLSTRLYGRPEFEGEEIVVVPSPMFSNRVVQGYSDIRFQTVDKVNGVKIKNLKHLVETLRDSKDDLLEISFNEEQCETMVLDRKAMMAATEDVLSDNSIRKYASDDLIPVWEKK